MMRSTLLGVVGVLALTHGTVAALAQDAKQLVQSAVQTELAADASDHSHWLYYEDDNKPVHPVKQWVAETHDGNLHRILQLDGQTLAPSDQRARMDAFVSDTSARLKQRKGEQHDDKQAAEMLGLLPRAFIWTNQGEKNGLFILHFKPDPSFDPPDLESRVFAAMEGDLAVDAHQHRIASLKGRMISDVKFFGGFFGHLDAGGTFDVERREVGPSIWQITETHVHIQGHALIFKSISEQEDDVKSSFKFLPATITLQQAESELLGAQR